MKFILGQKKGMTQIFNEQTGDVIPVTVVKAGPCPIIRLKKADDKDGYNAVVVGLSGKKKLGKRDLGQAKGLGNLQYIKEFRIDELDGLNAGQIVQVDAFQVGDRVKVVGTSKGKGFQGVVKRHGFHGQHATHGTKDQERAPGSIGATEPARVFPGMKMPGHMGVQRVTVKNLEIVKIDPQKHELYIKGAVPGAKGGLLMISCPGELKTVNTDKTDQQAKANDESAAAAQAENTENSSRSAENKELADNQTEQVDKKGEPALAEQAVDQGASADQPSDKAPSDKESAAASENNSAN